MNKNTTDKSKQQIEEVQPNKGFSFIVGICIGIAIIALFVLLFPN